MAPSLLIGHMAATKTQVSVQIWSFRTPRDDEAPRKGPHPPRAGRGDQACISLPSYRVEPEQTGPSVDCPRVGTRCVSRLFSVGRVPKGLSDGSCVLLPGGKDKTSR